MWAQRERPESRQGLSELAKRGADSSPGNSTYAPADRRMASRYACILSRSSRLLRLSRSVVSASTAAVSGSSRAGVELLPRPLNSVLRIEVQPDVYRARLDVRKAVPRADPHASSRAALLVTTTNPWTESVDERKCRLKKTSTSSRLPRAAVSHLTPLFAALLEAQAEPSLESASASTVRRSPHAVPTASTSWRNAQYSYSVATFRWLAANTSSTSRSSDNAGAYLGERECLEDLAVTLLLVQHLV